MGSVPNLHLQCVKVYRVSILVEIILNTIRFFTSSI